MIERSQVSQPIVAISDLAYRYEGNGVMALRDFSLDVARGSSVAVVGPSGCGKSTLLSLLAGLRTPSSGRLDWSADPDAGRHRLTMLFQQDTLLPWATVEQNVGLAFRFNRSRQSSESRAETEARIQELIVLAGLEGFEKAYPYQLSGGMRRRVAFLAAIAPLPQTLLLDEPFSSLDEPTRLSLHDMVGKMIRRFDITVVLVTHDLAESLSLCDEVVVVSRRPGRVVAQFQVPFGSERDIYHLRSTPEFLRLYGEIWDVLSDQIGLQNALEPGRGRPTAAETPGDVR